ncbi:hypothetical protein TNCV_4537431 [Trichonephila clavipes]|nr:hypothetical protein TNCV_4537431 [Trichonephila clavipes]
MLSESEVFINNDTKILGLLRPGNSLVLQNGRVGGIISGLLVLKSRYASTHNTGDDLVFVWVVNVIELKLALKRVSNYFCFVCIAESNTGRAVKFGNRGGFLPESFRNSPEGVVLGVQGRKVILPCLLSVVVNFPFDDVLQSAEFCLVLWVSCLLPGVNLLGRVSIWKIEIIRNRLVFMLWSESLRLDEQQQASRRGFEHDPILMIGLDAKRRDCLNQRGVNRRFKLRKTGLWSEERSDVKWVVEISNNSNVDGVCGTMSKSRRRIL